MIPYDEKSDKGIPWHTTFIGQPMQHNYWLYAVVDRVMLHNKQIKSIVEIGTGSGALSAVFGLWGIKRDIPVLTVDIVNRHDSKILSVLGVEYLEEDEMSAGVEKRILEVVGEEPTWLYCDGGCKRNEFRYYGPKMPVDSIISAHDFEVEFSEEDGKGLEGIEEYQKEWWLELNIQLALYKKMK